MQFLTSSAIGQRKYRIPSDLRSQALYRSVSTMVGDHMGILGAVVFIFLSDNCLLSLFALSLLALVLWGTVVRFLCNGHYNFYLQSNKKNAKGR